MRQSQVLATLLFIVIPSMIFAQPVERSYLNNVDKFFSFVKAGKRADAVDFIFSSNKWMTAKTDDIANVRTSFVGLPSLLGDYLGHELLIEESLGTRYVNLEYIVFFERQPFRLFFRFYKPNDTWVTDGFGYQGDLDEWISEKTKGKYLYFGNE